MKKKCLLLLATCICLFVLISFFSCEKDCQHCDADYDGLCDHCSESYMPDGEWSTVSFIVNGGDAIATQRLRHGASLPNAVRAGYTFGGWFTDTALCSSIAEVPSDNLTVYAYWTEENKPGDFVFEGEETLTVTDYTANDESVHVPAYIGGRRVDAIAATAFAECDTLTDITLSAEVSYISASAFAGCDSLMQMTVQSGNEVYHSAQNCIIETATQRLAFGCKGSTIPTDGSVTAIAEAAFQGCMWLTEITIPVHVTSIGAHAFEGCGGLATITVESDNETYHSEGNCLIETATGKLILGCKNSVIPTDGSVTVIGEYAFAGCTELTAITLPSGLTAVEAGAFLGCTALLGISIPTTVSSIGHEAFSGCTALAFAELPLSGNLTEIGNYAFEDCAEISDFYIPSSVCTIGFAAFSGCNSLQSITLPFVGNSKNQLADNTFGYIFGMDRHSAPKDVIPASLSTVVITGGTFIDNGAFSSCESITSITVPASVTTIGDFAFLGCTGLQTLIFGENSRLTDIYQYAFSGCESLIAITLPAGVKHIGKSVFKDCTALESINIPGSVTAIHYAAFEGCTALSCVSFENTVGWQCSPTWPLTGSTAISASDLTAFDTAATHLKSTYCDYYWQRT